MTPISLVFLGTPEFAVPSLVALAGSSHTISAVITGSDKKRGRGSALSPTPVKECAVRLGLPVFEADSTRTPEFAAHLKSLRPDLLVVVAYKILPPAVLAIPRLGSINLHASLLPQYRGAAPIHWAVVHGDTETGNTVFMLNDRVDAGAVLARERVPIGADETTGTVYRRLMEAGAPLVLRTVDALARGTAVPLEQNDALATPAPKVYPDMAGIRFDRPATEVHNRIRGFSPAPGAWALLDGQRVKLFGSRVVLQHHIPPGQAVSDLGECLIGCLNGAVHIDEIQFPGRSRVHAGAWIRAQSGQIWFQSEL